MDSAAFRRLVLAADRPGRRLRAAALPLPRRQDIFIAYEADPAGVDALLPPGLEAADEVPVCIAWGTLDPVLLVRPLPRGLRDGPRATSSGQVYLYQPFIFTDNEIPLVAGREIWGYAKKLAVIERSSGGGGASRSASRCCSPSSARSGQRIMTMSIACDAPRRPGRARGRAGALDAA